MILFRAIGIGLLIAAVAVIAMDGANMGHAGAATLTSVERLWSLLDAASLTWLRWQTDSGLLAALTRNLLDLPAGPFAAAIGFLALWIVHRGDTSRDDQIRIVQ